MSRTLLLVPIGLGVGLSTVCEGLVHALKKQGQKVCFLNPVTSDHQKQVEGEEGVHPLSIKQVESLLSKGEEDRFLEFLVAYYNKHVKEASIAIVQGIISTQLSPYAPELNEKISQTLGAEVIFVMAPGKFSPEEISEQIEIAANPYGGIKNSKVVGCMLNKVGAPVDQYGNARLDLFDPAEKKEDKSHKLRQCSLFQEKTFKLLGLFPWERQLMAPRVSDIQKHLGAKVLSVGNMHQARVMHLALAAATIEHMAKLLEPDTMILTPGDRSDVIVAVCMAYLSGVPLAALLLTCGYYPQTRTHHLCQSAMDKGLPILSVQTDSLRTAIALQDLSREIPFDDHERKERARETIARHIDSEWTKHLASEKFEPLISPPAFRYQLIEKARKKQCTIVLPEGTEPRILKAAGKCIERHIAKLILLGNPDEVKAAAKKEGVALSEAIQVIDPNEVREKYVASFVFLRKHKGATEEEARQALNDPVTLGTMMLAEGDVDGLVAGSTHTTAHTILPALKLIKTKPDVSLVSSVFFMCLPNQVLVYGDCAVNQNPTAEELSDIAIQSADTAERFGIPARVAMISYSTGSSSTGVDVEKIEKATKLIKTKRPDLLVDGPLQYDAAYSAEVAKKKAPNSLVAGQATVYIFPDLNTANTTYKAVQRSAHVLSIGPLLQGLKKPVNDLSRGATVEDIIFTIALTAVQVD